MPFICMALSQHKNLYFYTFKKEHTSPLDWSVKYNYNIHKQFKLEMD